jgi:hypothetical protein
MHPREYARLRDGSAVVPAPRNRTGPTDCRSGARKNENSQSPHIDDETLLTTAQTRVQVGGVSTMCLWRWQRDPRVNFPAPDMTINRRNYWYVGTIRRWKASQVRAAA